MANFTKTFHHQPYAAISPSVSASSWKDKTVLITGASEGIGFAIAKAFASTQAASIILVGRRLHALEAAIIRLTSELEPSRTTTFIPVAADVFEAASILTLWRSLADRGINVDGLVLNAARTNSNGDVDDEIAVFTANVTANILMLDCFLHKQKSVGHRNETSTDRGQGGKFLLNISSGAAHWNPARPGRQAYSASKAAFASYVQHMATQVDATECLMVNLHPGAVYTAAAIKSGVPKDSLVWDEPELAGAFCVWVAAQHFLHGRFLWVNWDAEELVAMKHEILGDVGMLKIGLQGVENVALDKHFATLRQRRQAMA